MVIVNDVDQHGQAEPQTNCWGVSGKVSESMGDSARRVRHGRRLSPESFGNPFCLTNTDAAYFAMKPSENTQVSLMTITAETWRKWEYGKGWVSVRSILVEMNNIAIGLCAVDAVRCWSDGTEQKIESEYLTRRKKNLGSQVDKAIKLAAALMGVDDWDNQPHLIGLPEGECLDIDATNATSASGDR